MSSVETVTLLQAAWDRLQPFVPQGVNVSFDPGVGQAVITRCEAPGVGGAAAGGIGGGLRPWIPFMPRPLRDRLTAQAAVEELLSVVYSSLRMLKSTPDVSELQVQSVNTTAGPEVSFKPVGADKRVSLPAFPTAIL